MGTLSPLYLPCWSRILNVFAYYVPFLATVLEYFCTKINNNYRYRAHLPFIHNYLRTRSKVRFYSHVIKRMYQQNTQIKRVSKVFLSMIMNWRRGWSVSMTFTCINTHGGWYSIVLSSLDNMYSLPSIEKSDVATLAESSNNFICTWDFVMLTKGCCDSCCLIMTLSRKSLIWYHESIL